MHITQTAAYILAILAAIPTIASLTRFDYWWIRDFDFPRLQISTLILFVIFYCGVVFSFENLLEIAIIILLVASFVYQAYKIFPYTFFAKKKVFRYKGEDEDRKISILVSNVLTPNKHYDKLIKLIDDENPDMVLTLESDKVWEKELAVIEEEYPNSVKIPLENLYGMHLYSKLELQDIEVKFLISKEIPSIHGKVVLRSGELLNFYCLHPKPPSPTEDDTSTRRDAELLLVGKEVDGKKSTLVFGDLNDVAWSRTTELFMQTSGLLDPRIGRGFFNTFHAQYPIFRWPLDHVFHSTDFLLCDIKRLPSIGSDHFPIYIKLAYEPEKESLNDNTEEPDEEEKEWVEEKIDKGLNPEKYELGQE